MGLTSLQVCMDSSDWLQGSMHEENNEMDSPSVTDMLTNAMPQAIMDQRRLRPPHDQALNCPRCDSTHTKFCYYNNYSLSQPRYFCKTCRRYWTKGGTLRNIPVGGGCRKNKKITPVKKTNANDHHQSNPGSSSSQNPVNFRVSEINNMFLGGQGSGFGGFSLLGSQETNSILPINFMEGSRSNLGSIVNGIGPNFNGNFSSSFGVSYDGGVENHNRLMFPYEGEGINAEMSYQTGIDVKPSTKLLSLDHHHNWQDHHQSCLDGGKDYSIGYHLNGLGSWNGMMNNGF